MSCPRPKLAQWPPFFACLLTVWLLPGLANAHAVQANCRIQGSRVAVEVFFETDLPAGDAQVTVLEESQQTLVARGRTDAAGHWSFPLPPPGSYQVKVDAGLGHRRTLELVVPKEASEGFLAATTYGLPPWLAAVLGLTAIGLFWLSLRWLVGKKPPAQGGLE